MSGWIKLHRKILDSKYGCNLELSGLFDRLLLMANHKEGFTADGTKILPGQFMTSQIELSKKFKTSRTKMQRMLEKLQKAEQIGLLPSPKNTIITIVNWERYQLDEHQAGNERATSGHQAGTNKNAKNNKNEKNTGGLSVAAEYREDFFSGVIDAPEKNLPEIKPQDFRKSKEQKKSPLAFLFSPDDEIQPWISSAKASVNVQSELLEKYSHHVLRDEVKTAYQWTLEKKPAHAGLFLKNWMKNVPEKSAYGFQSEEEHAQAARELYKSKFGVYPEEDQAEVSA